MWEIEAREREGHGRHRERERREIERGAWEIEGERGDAGEGGERERKIEGRTEQV